VTSANVITLSGAAEAGSTVKVYDGTTLLGNAIATAAGTWSFKTPTLSNGTHSLSATATDAAGNVSDASTVLTGPGHGSTTALTITVDTIAPATPTISSYSPDTGVVGDGITDANVLTFGGAAEADSTVKVYDGTTLLGSVIASALGTWSFTTSALADGKHALSATAMDLAGNISHASTAVDITVDTVAPIVPTITSFSPDTATVGDGITDAHVLNLSGSGEAGSTVKVYDGTTLLGNAVVGANGTWNYTTTSLNDGAHTFTTTDTDIAGNTSGLSSALHVTVDTVAPGAPTIASISPDAAVVGSDVSSIFTVTGGGEANSTVTVYDGSTAIGTAAVNGSGDWSFTTQSLTVGTHSFTAIDTDLAGNQSSSSAPLDVTVDSAPISVDVTGFLSSWRGIGQLSGTTEADSSLKVIDVTSGKTLAQVTANSAGTFSALMTTLTNTIHSFDVVATDQAGNTGQTHLIYGTSGADVLSSTSASEIFTGQGGSDTFVFSGNFGQDTITDFKAATDTIQLDQSAFTNFASVLSHATQVGGDVVIAQDAHNTLTLNDTTLSQLASHNFHLV
jgi:hypothetical protein